MKEHPIIFSTEMVRAILDRRKTQTRRVFRPPEPFDYGDDGIDILWYTGEIKCPYGQAGDKEWQSGMPPKDGFYYVEDFAKDKPVYLRRFLPEDYPSENIEAGLLWGEDEHDDPEAIEIEGLSLETIKWKRAGDRLWVRETFCDYCVQETNGVCYKACPELQPAMDFCNAEHGWRPYLSGMMQTRQRN